MPDGFGRGQGNFLRAGVTERPIRDRAFEAPTWAVAVAVHAGWFLTTFYYDALAWWLLAPLGAWFTTWHGSFQHEALHGHPTRWDRLNGLLAGLPVGLWMPYPIYRETHLVHHRNENLTCPINDPESFYQTAACWRRRGPLTRALYWAHDTLIGRLALGPAVAAWHLWRAEGGRIAGGDYGNLAVWLRHLLGVALVLYWVVGICGMPVWVYLICFAYPGLSMILLRSYAEHRAAVEVDHRTATVEAGWPLALLYLNNNLHFSHHQEPGLAWYKLPARYRAERQQTLARNGNYRFAGYLDLFRRRLRRTEKVPVHPFAPAET